MQVAASRNNQHDPKSVNASYSRISEAFRHVTAGPLQCQVFCGGKSCKYERSDGWSSEQMAIKGLYSHWVTETILAMARPNYTEMKKHNMIDSFKKAGVTTVINLQECGEHASCGNALHSSGFSYDPIEFMNNDIFYYNFNIQDYSVPLQRTLLDICKVVTFAQSEGKVSIHCHAGLGRTGVVIACFLVYHHKMKPKDAILLVRKNRPRSIQTRNQLKAVFRFANFLSPLWTQFPTYPPLHLTCTLEEIIANQKVVLHGLEGKTLKYTPKVLYDLCSWVVGALGQPMSVLSKKIRPINNEGLRPITCPASYHMMDSLDNEDLDSLTGGECSVREVEEMEEMLMSGVMRRARSLENLPDSATSTTVSQLDIHISNISHRLNLSPRPSISRENSGMLQKLLLNEEITTRSSRRDSTNSGSDGVHHVTCHVTKFSETVDEEETSSSAVLEMHNITSETKSSIDQFMAGLSGPGVNSVVQEGTEKSDLDMVIAQINVGIWESLPGLKPYDKGKLMRIWFSSLSKPIFGIIHVERVLRKCDMRVRENVETTPRYLDKLNGALETLPPCVIATLHCLATTFSLLLSGPFNLKRGEVLKILCHLLTQKGEEQETFAADLKRMTPVLNALLYSKRNELSCQSKA